MKISQLSIENLRGIQTASLLFPDHAVLIGDNNTGKSTVLEALDLVLGPDRLGGPSPISEHDFYLGSYLVAPTDGGTEEAPVPNPRIVVTATVTDLSEEQQNYFGDYIEWWDASKQELFDNPDPAGLDSAPAIPALRVTFIGQYDANEDDFEGKTFYTRTLDENETPEPLPSETSKNADFCICDQFEQERVR